jgi:hypothetical protein
LFKNRISANKERRREIETAKKRTDLGEGEKECIRTVSHVRHFPNLPCREITIEGTSKSKHCTTYSNNKEKSKDIKDKNGLKNKEERALFK